MLMADFTVPDQSQRKAVEHARSRARAVPVPTADRLTSMTVNPSLHLVAADWEVCGPGERRGQSLRARRRPPRSEYVMVWRHPRTGRVAVQAAGEDDLLALKVVMEDLDPRLVALQGGVAVGDIDLLVRRAVSRGILLKPSSRIRRPAGVPRGEGIPERFLSSANFTLQWHLTNACDLRCRHCYDRTQRGYFDVALGHDVLDQMWAFCRDRFVTGNVTFSGGNPALHPDFLELYAGAVDRGFSVSILGNPMPRAMVEELLDIRTPNYFQVSLEGLPEYNDACRGAGSFQRVLDFLDVLRDLGIPSQVMLTLNRDNMSQILPLAEMLAGRVDDFTFNRLSRTGAGAALELPEPAKFQRFLRQYLTAAEKSPHMALKDNLLNILRREVEERPFGGCTGFGCGAAFNFVALLPDGEVHACRKFPSLLGSVRDSSLDAIYESALAQRYRKGCSDCGDCGIRPVCGGCMAVAAGAGRDPFLERDPYCFAR